MKNPNLYFLITIFVMSIGYLHGQDQELKIGNNYFFKTNLGNSLTKDKMALVNKDETLSDEEIKAKAQIKIIDINNGTVYFKYLNYKIKDLQSLYNSGKVFSLSENYFKKFTEIRYNRFRGFKYGAYTVPIRLRSSNDSFEFDANLSLGANIVGRLGSIYKEHMFIDLSFGISITKINLNKENSILGQEGTDFEKVDVLSPSAFTVSFGALFNLSKNVNIGAYWGWDSLSSADNKTKWIYNKKPWLGIGLNVNFSGKAEDSNANDPSQG